MTMDINPLQRGKLHADHSVSLNSDSQSNVSSPDASHPRTHSSLRYPSPKTTIKDMHCYPQSTHVTSSAPARTIKRCFDVAFLMAPDAKLAKKQQQQKQEMSVAENCSCKSSSPTPVQATFSPSSPKILTSSKNSLLNVIHDSSSKETKDMSLLEGVIESVSRNSFILRSFEPYPKSPTLKPFAIAKQQSSNLGMFEENNFTVSRTNHQEVFEESGKLQASFNEKNELNVTTTSQIEDYSHDEFHEALEKEDTIGHKNYLRSETHNPCRVFIRSAFTKVTTSSKKIDSRSHLSPTAHASPSSAPSISSSLSPDHTTCQESMSPPVVPIEPSAPHIPSNILYSAGKPFPSTIPILIPDSHLSRHIPNHNTKMFPSTYSSGAYLLQQEDLSKPSDDKSIHSSVLSNNNSNLKSEIESYLKASLANPSHHQICRSVTDSELIQYFPSNISSSMKLRPNNLFYQHHPESIASYSSLSASTYPFSSANFSTSAAAELLASRSQHSGLLASVPGPAATVVSASILPPSFAALSLPAQNICAKCNISFRMTSDLVYHMRSHHKGDHYNGDSLKRRREQDKLKCPVCNESFRERHHLTRHMTAHQDKEGDASEDLEDAGGVEGAGRRGFSTSSPAVGRASEK